jgi:hypothetical protein
MHARATRAVYLMSKEGGRHMKDLVARAKNILARPKAEWPVIEAEQSTVGGLYTRYLMILAAIPAVAAFIGMSLIGVGAFGVSFRVPIANGVASMVAGYVLSLIACGILALVIDVLAPVFGGHKNRLNAFKVAVYGSTAALVGGIFSLLPMLSILGLVAALYSIYLVYLGLPALMKCTPDKALPYTAVTIVAAIVLGIALGAASNAFRPDPAGGLIGGLSGGAPITMTTPQGKVTVNADDGGSVTVQTEEGTMSVNTADLDNLAERMEKLGQKLDAARESGNVAEMEKLTAEMQQALMEGYASQ